MPINQTRLIWLLIAAMSTLTVVSFALTGLSIDLRSNPFIFPALAVPFAIGWYYSSIRPDFRLKIVATSAGQLFLILLCGILLTYAAMATDFPYRDAELYAIDRFLGFDRQAYLSVFSSRPWLQSAAGFAYLSFLPQFALVPPLLLFFSDQTHRLQILILAFGAALILTSAISALVPAVDAFVYVDITPSVFAKISAQLKTQVPTLEALRSGALHFLRLNDLEGLITFPSFHTTGGLLFAWALLKTPYLRWPALAINGALIASTPVVGAHYFIDLVGGAAVAAISLFASQWLYHASAPRRPATSPELGALQQAEENVSP